MIQIISSIRSTRSELNVPPKSMVDIKYDQKQPGLKLIFENYSETLKSITRINGFDNLNGSREEGDIQIIVNDEIFYLSLLNIIDFKVEGVRLEKNLIKINMEIEKINNKLKSPNFANNAPESIINEQKDRLEEYSSSKDKIEDAIKSFSS